LQIPLYILVVDSYIFKIYIFINDQVEETSPKLPPISYNTPLKINTQTMQIPKMAVVRFYFLILRISPQNLRYLRVDFLRSIPIIRATVKVRPYKSQKIFLLTRQKLRYTIVEMVFGDWQNILKLF
jgi:hypothetical protein